jgi:hypothetical protein
MLELPFKFVRKLWSAVLDRWRPFRPPEDPFAGVSVPRRRSPHGRSSAAAVDEPEPETRVRAVARAGRSR